MAIAQKDLELIERVIYKNGDDIAVSIGRSFERLEERIDAGEMRQLPPREGRDHLVGERVRARQAHVERPLLLAPPVEFMVNSIRRAVWPSLSTSRSLSIFRVATHRTDVVALISLCTGSCDL